MKKGNNEIHEIKDFDEVIKMACQKNVDESDCDRIITDEERIASGKKVPSDDIMLKIKKNCKKRQHEIILPDEKETKTEKLSIYKFKTSKKFFVVALIATFLIGALGATAMKELIFDKKTYVMGGSVETHMMLSKQTEEEKRVKQSYDEAEAKMGVDLLIPAYVPEGMNLESVRATEKRARITYRGGENGTTICFLQQITTAEIDYGNIVNATEPGVDKRTISGKDVAIVAYEQDDTGKPWIKMTWAEDIKNSNNVMKYEVDTDIPEEELVKFIENLQ